jgi:CAAX protease family protein
VTTSPAVADPTEAVPTARWGIPDAVVTLVLYAVLSLGSFWVLGGLLGLGDGPTVVGSLILGQAALALYPIWVVRQKGRGVRHDLALSIRWVDLGVGMLAALAAVSLTVLYVLVALLVGVTPTAAAAEIASGISGPWFVALAVSFAVIGPIAEELSFRGLWWGALAKRGLSPLLATVVSGIVFGLGHLEPTRAILLVVLGLLLGGLRWWTGRLGAGIVAHMVINGLATAAIAVTA